MTPDEFRAIALSLPDAWESAHGGHPDFRVGRRIFATLGYPDPGTAMVKLTPEQQELLVEAEPQVFRPVKGAWGKRGSTHVALDRLDLAQPRARSTWRGETWLAGRHRNRRRAERGDHGEPK